MSEFPTIKSIAIAVILYGEVNGMENNMFQAILDEIKKIDNKIDGVSSELKLFREETKKEFNQINIKLDRLKENQLQDITAHLKQL